MFVLPFSDFIFKIILNLLSLILSKKEKEQIISLVENYHFLEHKLV